MDENLSLEPDFIDEESKKNIEDYICCICQLIPHFHYALEETNCGHIFCSKCINKWMEKEKKCPFCKTDIKIRKIETENKMVFRYLINLKIKCKIENCEWKGAWSELEQHMKKVHYKKNDDNNINIVFIIGEKYKSTLHKHLLEFLGKTENAWKCDAVNFGNCESGIKKISENKEIPHFFCKECNFNLCEKCMRNNFENEVKNKEKKLNENNKNKENDLYIINHFYLCKSHKHLVKYLGITNANWWCNGRIEEEKCLSKITKFGQTGNIPRFRCDKCDFDLCLKCFEHHKIESREFIVNKKYKFRAHEHNLVYLGKTNSEWFCDGKKFRDGCLNGIKKVSKNVDIPKFRCDKCDFDLCVHCFEYYDVIKSRCSIF